MYHSNIEGMLKIHFCAWHIKHVLKLPGTDVFLAASLQITLTFPRVGGTDNWVTSNLPFMLNTSSITRLRSQPLVTDSHYNYY